MRAFITGVTGFVGSHLAEHLLASGDVVLGCSRNNTWDASVPTHVIDQIPLVTWDLTTDPPHAPQEQVAAFRPDVVYHLAAISVPSDCGNDEPSPRAIAANVEGTRQIAKFCQSLVAPPRLVFVSSCHVYAPVTAEQAIVTEDAPVGPVRAYGKTKLAAERLLQTDGNAGLDVVVARSFQHTGPRQSPRMILPDWATQLVKQTEEPIRVVCLDTHLDLTDVRDIVRAYRLLAVDGIRGSVYNVGSGISRRSGEILEEMQKRAGSTREVVELRPGRRQHPIADTSRLLEQTGWRPEIPFERTIIDTLDYWRKRGTDS